MKRLIAFTLLSAVLSTTGFYQLLKIPFLYEHYLEHSQANSNLDAIEFMLMHYSAEYNHTSAHQHKKLPFKSNDEIIYTPLLLASFNQSIKICKPIIPIRKVYIVSDEKRIPTSYSASIWQPPRVC